MRKSILTIGFAALLSSCMPQAAFADEETLDGVVVPAPIVCFADSEAYLNQIAELGFFPVWFGIDNNDGLTTLFVNDKDEWKIVLQIAGKVGICQLKMGTVSFTPGEEAHL